MLSDAAPPALSPIVTTGAAKPEGQSVAEYGYDEGVWILAAQ